MGSPELLDLDPALRLQISQPPRSRAGGDFLPGGPSRTGSTGDGTAVTASRVPIASGPEHELDHPVHLVPLVQELLARGHRLVTAAKPYDGFEPTRDKWVCVLERPITWEDWVALNEKFDIPPTIHRFGQAIRDDLNWCDIVGGGETI